LTPVSARFLRRTIVSICLLSCAAVCGCQKNSSNPVTVSAQDAERKNPVEASPASIEQGQKLYDSSDCAICHGKSGDGKGVLAKDINMNTHNWHDAQALSTLTDGELFFILAKGKGRMPGYEKRETPDQMWQMVDSIRALGNR
jgi:mono/diheme cytochrome c family protein